MKKQNIWTRTSAWLRAFLILALAFLALGLGTLGSVSSAKDSYTIRAKNENDGLQPCVIFNLSQTYREESNEALYVKEVYFNLAEIYAPEGEVATLRLARGASESSSYYNGEDIRFANFYSPEDAKNPALDGLFHWAKYTVETTNGWRISTYPYYSLTALDYSVRINEIVFVANNLSGDGEPVVVPAKVHKTSVLPYDVSKGETEQTALEKAGALVDCQALPSLSQSSFFCFTEDEVRTLLTVSEARRGGEFAPGETYHIDGVYNSFGIDLIMIGTSVFGLSPFGLRFIPFLAAFGALVFGFLFVRRLAKSEKAGFVFAVLYVLSGMPFSLGHLGVPLMIGVFFFTAALYFCYRFFEDGMKRADVLSAVPAALAGLFSACAVCVHGAFVIPCVGIVALFGAGMFRSIKERREQLDLAIAEAEKEEAAPAPAEKTDEENGGAQPLTGRRKVAKTLSDYRFKHTVAPAFFGVALVIGAFLISVLSALPLYYNYVKFYDNPASPSRNVFYFVWKAFAGGFTGSGYSSFDQTPWTFFYLLLRHSEANAAGKIVNTVTATGTLVGIAAVVAGLAGLVLTVVRLARGTEKESFREDLTRALVLLCGAVLSLVTASFAPGGLAFLFLAYLFLFAFAGNALAESDRDGGKTAFVLNRVALGWVFVLAVCFGLFAVFTFSIPTVGFMTGLIG